MLTEAPNANVLKLSCILNRSVSASPIAYDMMTWAFNRLFFCYELWLYLFCWWLGTSLHALTAVALQNWLNTWWLSILSCLLITFIEGHHLLVDHDGRLWSETSSSVLLTLDLRLFTLHCNQGIDSNRIRSSWVNHSFIGPCCIWFQSNLRRRVWTWIVFTTLHGGKWSSFKLQEDSRLYILSKVNRLVLRSLTLFRQLNLIFVIICHALDGLAMVLYRVLTRAFSAEVYLGIWYNNYSLLTIRSRLYFCF